MEEKEQHMLERLKRTRAHQKESKTFIPLANHCKLFCGSKSCLRKIEQKQAALLIIPKKIPEQIRQLFLSVALTNSCPVWFPNVTSNQFGKVLGIKNGCIACIMTKSDKTLDPLGSIRDDILEKFLSDEQHYFESKA